MRGKLEPTLPTARTAASKVASSNGHQCRYEQPRLFVVLGLQLGREQRQVDVGWRLAFRWRPLIIVSLGIHSEQTDNFSPFVSSLELSITLTP